MAVSELDRQYLEKYVFDDPPQTTHSLIEHARQITAENKLLVDGFVEGHAGEVFALIDVAVQTGLDPGVCRKIIIKHPLVEQPMEPSKRPQYTSVAPELVPLVQEPVTTESLERQALGEQARADWYDLVRERSKNVRKKYKVMQHF